MFTMYECSDEQLVNHIQVKGPCANTAFSELTQRHHASLLNRCTVLLNNRQDAEDAVQETLLRAYRFIHNFRGDSLFKSWLYRIADRQCYTQLRQLKKKQQNESAYFTQPDTLHYLDTARDTQDIAIQQQECANLHQHLTKLPLSARNALAFRFFKELPNSTVSNTLKLTRSGSKMRVHRALEQLRQQYLPLSA